MIDKELQYTVYHCLKCEEPITKMVHGRTKGTDIWVLVAERPDKFYCKNEDCEFYGVMVTRSIEDLHGTEPVIQNPDEKPKTPKKITGDAIGKKSYKRKTEPKEPQTEEDDDPWGD